MKNKIWSIIIVVISIVAILGVSVLSVGATSVNIGNEENTVVSDKIYTKSIVYDYGGKTYTVDGGGGFSYDQTDTTIYGQPIYYIFDETIDDTNTLLNDNYFYMSDYDLDYFSIDNVNYFSGMIPLKNDGKTYGYDRYTPTQFGDTWDSLSFTQWQLPYTPNGKYNLTFDVVYTKIGVDSVITPGTVSIMIINPSGEALVPLYITQSDAEIYTDIGGFDFTYTEGNNSYTKINISFTADYTNNLYEFKVTDLNGKFYTQSVSFNNDVNVSSILKFRYTHSGEIPQEFGGFQFRNPSLKIYDDSPSSIQNGITIQNDIYPQGWHITTYKPYGEQGLNAFSGNSIKIYLNDFSMSKSLLWYVNQFNINAPVGSTYSISYDVSTYNNLTSVVKSQHIEQDIVSSSSLNEGGLDLLDYLYTNNIMIFDVHYVFFSNIEIIINLPIDSREVSTSYNVLEPGLISDYQAFLEYVSNTNYQENLNDFNLGDFLANSVGGFLDFEIIPSLSIGGMLAIFLSLAIIFVFLKYFAGG